MQSVSSETATAVSYQNAPQRPARSAADQSQANDIFAGLVDNNTAADANNAASQAQQQSAPQNWPDNASSANNPWNNQAPASQPANNNSNNQDTNNSGPATDPNAGASTTDAPPRSRSKSTDSQDDPAMERSAGPYRRSGWRVSGYRIPAAA